MDDKFNLSKVFNFFKQIRKYKNMKVTTSENLEFLQTLIETIPNAIFYKDSDLIYKHCNNAFLELLGLRRDEVIGHSVYDISPTEMAQIYQKADEDLIKSKSKQMYESKVKYADGSHHDVIFNKAVVLNKEGQVIGMVGVIIDITERVRSEEKIIYLSRHDKLTGLYNRGYFEELFEKYLKENIDNNKEFFLVILDLNKLKLVNDTYGHLAGDEYISRFASNLQQLMSPYDIVSRLGGDEFSIICYDESLQQLTKKFEDLQDYLKRNLMSYKENKNLCGFSYGIASFPQEGKDYNTLMKIADVRMYKYKQNYK